MDNTRLQGILYRRLYNAYFLLTYYSDYLSCSFPKQGNEEAADYHITSSIAMPAPYLYIIFFSAETRNLCVRVLVG